MTEGPSSVKGREKTVREAEAPAHPQPSVERGEDAAADERTSPFPYAEKFDEWVADETAATDGQPRGAAGETGS